MRKGLEADDQAEESQIYGELPQPDYQCLCSTEVAASSESHLADKLCTEKLSCSSPASAPARALSSPLHRVTSSCSRYTPELSRLLRAYRIRLRHTISYSISWFSSLCLVLRDSIYEQLLTQF